MEREGGTPRKKEPSAVEREGGTPRKKEPSAVEREGGTPRKKKITRGARGAPCAGKPNGRVGRVHLLPQREAGNGCGLDPRDTTVLDGVVADLQRLYPVFVDAEAEVRLRVSG